jgi:hypothetical protein
MIRERMRYAPTFILSSSSHHLLIFSSSHLFIFSSSHPLISSSSHLFIFSSSHLLIFSSYNRSITNLPKSQPSNQSISSTFEFKTQSASLGFDFFQPSVLFFYILLPRFNFINPEG